MNIVLDASAGIEIALDRPKASSFNQKLLSADKTISSALYKAEVANVLWKYASAGLLDKEKAIKALNHAQGLVDEFIDISDNNEEAMNEALRLGHSVYDLLYFTLARRYSSTLLTLDAKQKTLSKKAGIDVVS